MAGPEPGSARGTALRGRRAEVVRSSGANVTIERTEAFAVDPTAARLLLVSHRLPGRSLQTMTIRQADASFVCSTQHVKIFCNRAGAPAGSGRSPVPRSGWSGWAVSGPRPPSSGKRRSIVPSTFGVAVIAVVSTASCTAGETRLPCPPKGIGVEHVGMPAGGGGEPCQGSLCMWTGGRYGCSEQSDVCLQIAEHKRFACNRPQICPDVGGKDAQFVRRVLGSSSKVQTVTFLVSNCSTGDEDLIISRVKVYGDERCSFTDVTDNDIGAKTVRPGETTAIRTSYDPASVGEDHAELRVYSNAQNFPELRLPLCGAAVAAAPDGGAPDGSSDGGTRDAFGGPVACKERTSPSSCHLR